MSNSGGVCGESVSSIEITFELNPLSPGCCAGLFLGARPCGTGLQQQHVLYFDRVYTEPSTPKNTPYIASLKHRLLRLESTNESVISHRQNDVLRVLTVISTLFIPLTFIAGIYGMNFNTADSPWNMPELNWYLGYPLCLALMANGTASASAHPNYDAMPAGLPVDLFIVDRDPSFPVTGKVLRVGAEWLTAAGNEGPLHRSEAARLPGRIARIIHESTLEGAAKTVN